MLTNLEIVFDEESFTMSCHKFGDNFTLNRNLAEGTSHKRTLESQVNSEKKTLI